MAKKNEFFDEEVIEVAEDKETEAVAEAEPEVPEEAVAEIEPAEPEVVVAEAPAEAEVVEAEDDDTAAYEDIEEVIAIEEAEKKRIVKRIVSFVCLGVAVVGAVAVLYKLFFGKDD